MHLSDGTSIVIAMLTDKVEKQMVTLGGIILFSRMGWSLRNTVLFASRATSNTTRWATESTFSAIIS